MVGERLRTDAAITLAIGVIGTVAELSSPKQRFSDQGFGSDVLKHIRPL
jgi:hypothetical protein